MSRLPSFATLWDNYPNGEPAAVKAVIGGHVDAAWITNTCVVRMCYALNHSGAPIHSAAGLTTIRGGDGFVYGFRVSEFKRYMTDVYGHPQPFGAGMQGIICFDVSVWSDATGHFDLWNGTTCRHEGYFSVASAEHIWAC